MKAAIASKLNLPLTIADDGGWPLLLDAYGEDVAKVSTQHEAVFIVEACNSHAQLLTQRDALEAREKVLREIVYGAIALINGDCPLTETNCDDWLRRARAALATGAAK